MKYLNYAEHLLILVSTVTGCVWISAFASLVCGPVASSATRIKICAFPAGIKKYMSIIKKKKKNHNKIVLLGEDKLNTNEVLISKSLIDSYISHVEFVSVNNVLREYKEIKEKIKTSVNILYKDNETYCVSCKKSTANENSKANPNSLMLLSNCAVCGKKNQLLLKIKNLIIFQIITLKWTQSLIYFYWLETNLWQNCIWNS